MTSAYGSKICIVADVSDSALAHWRIVRQTVLCLCRLLETRFTINIYLLGDCDPISRTWVEQQHTLEASFPRRIACSFITPTLGALLRSTRNSLHAVVMVGNGEIADISDWLEEPRVERWIAVQVDAERTCSDVRIPTWSHSEIDEIIVAINTVTMRHQHRTPIIGPQAYCVPSVSWTLDRIGYPLIQVDILGGAYVHLFPVAKAQFEHFLAQPGQPLGDYWYEQILAQHPRGKLNSPEQGSAVNLFMTGLLPDEVARFGSWMGRSYRLMTVDEWVKYYTWLAALPLVPEPPAQVSDRLNHYAAKLWHTLCRDAPSETFASVSIGHADMLEAVVDPSYAAPNAVRWMGQSGLLKATTGVRPAKVNVRKYNVGFRLVTTRVS